MEELIDKFLANSEIEPIIIVPADEGAYPDKLVRIGENYDVKHATKMEIKQKVGILNAFYLPGFDRSILYPSITPVNSFRIIFNHYFNSNIKLLPDESYISEVKYYYKMYRVTDEFGLE